MPQTDTEFGGEFIYVVTQIRLVILILWELILYLFLMRRYSESSGLAEQTCLDHGLRDARTSIQTAPDSVSLTKEQKLDQGPRSEILET